MILKEADNKGEQLATLEALLAAPALPTEKKALVERELKMLRAGIKGESESAYDIDFYSGAHKNRIVIHDLRLEHGGRVAQIDHLVLNRLLEVYVLETKHFTDGVSINEAGEFSVWFAGKPKGIPSPLEQNDRHIEVLRDVFATLKMPTRLGLRLQPTFESLILVAKNARISRPKGFDTRRVLKSDQLETWIEKNIESGSPLLIAKLVAVDTLADIARQLVALHRPMTPNYFAKFGISEDILRTSGSASEAELAATSSSAVRGVAPPPEPPLEKLTTSKLAKKVGVKTADLLDRLTARGFLELRDGKHFITDAGKKAGGEFRMSPKFGPYFLWPDSLQV